jgi:uncharacterized protein YjbI with pentapeptide repeats
MSPMHLARGSLGFVALISIACLTWSTFGIAQVRNYRDRDLHGQDLSKQKMQNQDFSRANLQGADLSFTDFSNSILKNANLRGANLNSARFSDADLTEADLRETQTSGASFRNARLAKANLSGLTLFLAGAAAHAESYSNLPSGMKYALESVGGTPDADNGSLNFQGANLSDAKIFGNLEGVNFRGTDLRGADLSATDHTLGANFRGAVYDNNTRWSIDPAAAGAIHSGK